VGAFLTYISPFSYHINPDGSLTAIDDNAILQAARMFRVAPMLVITNFRGGNFDTEMVDSILSNTTLQQTLINNIITTMRTKGYYACLKHRLRENFPAEQAAV